MHRFNKLRIMKDETIAEIRERYINRTSKIHLANYYRVPLRVIKEIVKGLETNPRKTTEYEKAVLKREDVILMYLNGFKKVEIEAKTGLTAYYVTTFVDDFEKSITPRKSIDENLDAIRRQEAKLISMAEELAKGNGSETTYKTLLSVHAAAEPFHGGVFDV